MLDPKLVPTSILDRRLRPPVRIRSKSQLSHRRLRLAGALVALLARCVVLVVRRRLTATEVGRVARRFVEDLGGMWVKLAQLASLRYDLYPGDFCLELMKVQDQAQGFPGAEARRIVEEDLGRPIEEVFSSFDEAPIAAASIGQVHVAVLLREGCRVAVKVQRPEIVHAFDSDLRLLRLVFWFLRRIRRLKRLQLAEVLLELSEALEEELDYRREAYHIRRMRRILRKMDVLAPKTWKRYNRRRVLVMEYFDCVFMSDYLTTLQRDPERARAWLAENDIDPGQVGRKLYRTFLRQTLEEPYFHSDLHPGNIALFRGGRLGLIDFGAVGPVFADFRRPMIRYIRSMGERNFKQTIDRMMFVFEPIPPIDLDEFKREMYRVILEWDANTTIPTLPFHQKSAVYLYTEMGKLALRFNLPFDWTYLRVDRANVTMNTSLMHLCPDMVFPKEIARYFEGHVRRQLARAVPDAEWFTGTALAVRKAARRIAETSDNVESLFKRSSVGMQANTSKVAFAFLAVTRIGRHILEATGVLLVLAFLEQQLGALPGIGTAVLTDSLVGRFPSLGWADWLLAVGLFLSFRRMFQECEEILGRKDGGSYRM